MHHTAPTQQLIGRNNYIQNNAGATQHYINTAWDCDFGNILHVPLEWNSFGSGAKPTSVALGSNMAQALVYQNCLHVPYVRIGHVFLLPLHGRCAHLVVAQKSTTVALGSNMAQAVASNNCLHVPYVGVEHVFLLQPSHCM